MHTEFQLNFLFDLQDRRPSYPETSALDSFQIYPSTKPTGVTYRNTKIMIYTAVPKTLILKMYYVNTAWMSFSTFRSQNTSAKLINSTKNSGNRDSTVHSRRYSTETVVIDMKFDVMYDKCMSFVWTSFIFVYLY